MKVLYTKAAYSDLKDFNPGSFRSIFTSHGFQHDYFSLALTWVQSQFNVNYKELHAVKSMNSNVTVWNRFHIIQMQFSLLCLNNTLSGTSHWIFSHSCGIDHILSGFQPFWLVTPRHSNFYFFYFFSTDSTFFICVLQVIWIDWQCWYCNWIV